MLPSGSVALDTTALETVKSKDITVSVETVKPADLTDLQKEAIGDRKDEAVIVDVNVLAGSERVSTFNGGAITISVPYTLKAGEDPDKLTIWYIADDGKVVPMNGTYDAATKSVKFTTTHLSTYAIVSVSEERLSGDSRYDTMLKIARSAFPEGCSAAIVASGADFPDALAASSLAGVYGCPVLLTEPGTLSAQTAEAIRELGISKVRIVGGPGAVSDEVKASLEQLCSDTQRICGNDRTQTADRIAELVTKLVTESAAGTAVGTVAGIAAGTAAGTVAGTAAGTAAGIAAGIAAEKSGGDTVIIASGSNFPDALSISAYAYAQKMPILLTGADGKLTSESLEIAGRFSRAIIVGGTGAVSEDVEEQLKAVQTAGADAGQLKAVQAAGAGAGQLKALQTVRYGGQDRYETSEMIINNLYGGKSSVLTIASGSNFPDALSGACIAGSDGGALLLADGSQTALTAAQQAIVKASDSVYVLGGSSAVSAGLEKNVIGAMK